jgi:hypothetical protein
MGLLERLRRKKGFDPLERRRHLLSTGRIADGVIIDTSYDRDGNEIAYYVYTLNGVDFESSEVLTEEQRLDPVRYAPGANVGIRYDPKNQGNSVIE